MSIQRLEDDPSFAQRVRYFLDSTEPNSDRQQVLTKLRDDFGFTLEESIFVLLTYFDNEPHRPPSSDPTPAHPSRPVQPTHHSPHADERTISIFKDSDLYLDPQIKSGMRLEVVPAPRASLPFPANAVPQEMRSQTYFVEHPLQGHFYLRSTRNPLFCQFIWPVRVTFEEAALDSEGVSKFSPNGERVTEKRAVECLVTTFEGLHRTVGYRMGEAWHFFLTMFPATKPYEELPINLKRLYGAAGLGRKHSMSRSDTEFSK